MHERRLDYFKLKYKKGDMASCILKRQYAHLIIGSPGLVSVSPFKIMDKAHNNDGVIQYGPHIDNRPERNKSKTDKVSLSKVVAKFGEEDKLNEAIRRSLSTIGFLSLFTTWPDSVDFYETGASTADVYLVHKPPVLWDDTAYRTDIEKVGDHFSKSDLKNLPDLFLEKLKDHRYLVYTFRNINSTKRSEEVVKSFADILDPLLKLYTTSFTYSIGSTPPAPFDEMSISIYRLGDAMPIFDTKSAKQSLVMDVAIVSTDIRKENVYSKYASMSVKSIFSISKENVFTIDGDRIHRECEKNTLDMNINLMDKLIKYCAKGNGKKKSASAADNANVRLKEEISQAVYRKMKYGDRY